MGCLWGGGAVARGMAPIPAKGALPLWTSHQRRRPIVEITPAVGVARTASARSGGLLCELNVETQADETTHHTIRGPLAVDSIEVACPKIIVRRAIPEHVPDRDHDPMSLLYC